MLDTVCSEGNTEHIELLMLDESEIKVAQYQHFKSFLLPTGFLKTTLWKYPNFYNSAKYRHK